MESSRTNGTSIRRRIIGDPFLNGPAFLKAQAERQSEETKSRVGRMTRQQLMNRGDVVRILQSDDLMKVIQRVAQSQYNNALERLLDPSKRFPNETMEELRAEAAAHKVYVDLFNVWLIEGKEALKKLLNDKNGKDAL